MKHFTPLLMLLQLTMMACASAPTRSPETRPSTNEKPNPTRPQPVAPQAIAPPPPAAVMKPSEPKVSSQSWRLKKGDLVGPNVKGRSSHLISKTKNRKSPGTTSETCYHFGNFAIVELRSTDEIGTAELAIRHAPPAGTALCAADFKGKSDNLRLIEGYFSGVAGDFIVVDGADSSEGQTEFQIFAVADGREVMKAYHHPSEDFVITKTGAESSLEYFAKMTVKCELAAEGGKCWKKVNALNHVRTPGPIPDCAKAYAVAKTPLTEPALVFGRARVGRLGQDNVKFLGGKATCQPAP